MTNRRESSPHLAVAAMWLFAGTAMAAILAFTWGGVMVPHGDRELAAASPPTTEGRPAQAGTAYSWD